MSWLDKLESFWSSFFERPFRRGEAGIQPVEIAKHLARTMHANRTISISRVYVPNIFLVYLSLRDWERLSSFLRALAAEMEDFLRERATEQGYTLVGDPKVEFEIDDNLKPGEISIHCRLEEKAPAEEISGNTLTYVPLDKK
ncbi:MAG: hypothetical protein PWP65_1916, partial [Clostridia bacterium]|nr:hypothetical protein [Clostridia bacterium]